MKWGLMGRLGAGLIWLGFWFGISLVYLGQVGGFWGL